ncbi:MAG: ATP-binding protein [Archangium sp.]|nr:ATP-binding protein [Archangium sp.]
MKDQTMTTRVQQLYDASVLRNYEHTSRIFAVLMGAQWLFGIFVALVVSPLAWEGKTQTASMHLWAAVLLGGVLSALPIGLALTQPGSALTRNVVAAAQMLWGALLIHLTGGRIETHFHIFGSLAFVAFYRDLKPIFVATAVVVADHFLRGVFLPESVYGITNPAAWRFFEHAGWVVFEDVVLVFACLRGLEEMRVIAERQAIAEEKSVALQHALDELKENGEALARSERLAAVGQLAASVGHELRNPLAAVRNAHTYLAKRLTEPGNPLATDARVGQFVGLVERELNTCAKIISDLLDFSRERAPALNPCPLRPLVDEAIGLVPQRAGVTVVNRVPEELPVPSLDKDQFRQVLINLVQNAVEAMPERGGEVSVVAEGGQGAPWKIRVVDNGSGIPAEVVGKIFEPLFSTKNKGTGLGLAIVSNMIRKHGGTISVDSAVGRGTEFHIVLPLAAPPAGVSA